MTTATQKISSEYKQTEIGMIPADWGVKQLKDLVLKVIDNRGKTPPYSNNPDVELIETTSISFVTKYPDYSKITKFVSKKTYDNWFRAHPTKDDVLVSTVGEYSGSSAIMGENRGTIAQNLIALRIKNIDPIYAFYWTRSGNFREQLDQVMMNQAQPSLRVPWLLNFYLNIPRPEEQIAITKVLSDTDKLIEGLKKLIEKKKSIKQGAVQELLTGKRRLPGFSGKWEMKKLNDIAEFVKGKGLSKSKLSDGGDYPCILYGELFTTYSRVIREVKSRTNIDEGVRSLVGDILLPGSTTTVGIDLAIASALQQNDVLLGGDVIVIRKKEQKYYDPEFLANYLTHISKYEIAGITQGITIIHLHASRLKEISVKIPNDVTEQSAIATTLSDMDVEIEKLESQLTKYQNIKQGMMQTLLTGKIRLLTK